VEGNWRREHGEVVEGTGGEVNEHRGVKAELGDAMSSPGGGRRRLAPRECRRQRAAEQSDGGACAWMKAKWGKPPSARPCAKIKPRPRGAVATGGVRSPPHHRTQCRTRAHG
jgi:hypothetical protein